MARAKEFDPTAALDAAMRTFWRKGYEGTSTADLVADLGIGRASLYATFGSKRDLYLAALDQFIAGAPVPAPPGALAGDRFALHSVRAFLETSLRPAGAPDPPGCFAVNATAEHADSDADVSLRLEANRHRLEAALHRSLLAARAQGELAAGIDPKAAAAMLSALNTGLKVLARAGGQDRSIRSSIDAAMDMLAVRPRSG